jgi:glycosyltransferase involved in cell wall biosynthesis
MKDLKFLIILAYYKRPKMVLNALESIKNLSYQNWNLEFIDDSGDDDFKSTLLNYGLDNSKINYVAICDSEEQKLVQGGSRHGEFMNNAIHNSDSDVVIILCDDDAIIDGYFEYLNEYYNLNPEVNWAYSKVMFFNPSLDHYSQSTLTTNYTHQGSVYNTLNQYEEPIYPYCKVDGSQVSFRTKVFKEGNIFYPSPQTRNLDAAIFSKIYNQYGYCYPTFTYGQYKGVFEDQLGNRFKDNNNEYTINEA